VTLEPMEPGVAAPPRKRRSKLRWALHLTLLGLVALALLLVVRAARFETRQLVVEPIPKPDLDWAAAAERLGGAVRIQTISRSAQGNSFSALRREDSAAFKAFHAYLSRSFPESHRVMQREVIAEHSLLYEWKGSDASLEPVVIGAHMDVAPITPGTSMSWTENGRFSPASANDDERTAATAAKRCDLTVCLLSVDGAVDGRRRCLTSCAPSNRRSRADA